MSGLALLLLSVAATPSEGDTRQSCAQEVGASETATRLAELPDDIRGEISRRKDLFGEHMSDSDAALLQTDAPTVAEKDHVEVKFSQAYLIKDTWFVQFEVAMTAGVRTTSFPKGSDGHFHFQPSHYFGGPACASIKAALDGVMTPSGPVWSGY